MGSPAARAERSRSGRDRRSTTTGATDADPSGRGPRRRGVGLRPVLKRALRESFLAEPETLPVVGQKLDRVTSPRTEYKKRAAQWVAGQHLPAERGQAFDAFSKIDGFDRHENPHLRSDLNHRPCRRNTFTNARSSSDPAAPRCTMSRAPQRWIHSTMPRSPPPPDAPPDIALGASSTKPGAETGTGAHPAWRAEPLGSRRCKS